jgi:hypothetical protein
MAETDSERTSRADSLAEQSFKKEIFLAEQRGKERTEVDARLRNHEERINSLDRLVTKSISVQDELKDSINKLSSSFEKTTAIAEARAADAKIAMEKQVSTRTFVLGLIGATSALGGILAATGHT